MSSYLLCLTKLGLTLEVYIDKIVQNLPTMFIKVHEYQGSCFVCNISHGFLSAVFKYLFTYE